MRGAPVAPFNRRVIHVPSRTPNVETGSYKAVKYGKGKIKNEYYLGRVVVPAEDHLWIVQQWINDALEGTGRGGLSDVVLCKLKEIIAANSTLPEGVVDGMELDLWCAEIINHNSGDKVFVNRQPNSFP